MKRLLVKDVAATLETERQYRLLEDQHLLAEIRDNHRANKTDSEKIASRADRLQFYLLAMGLTLLAVIFSR